MIFAKKKKILVWCDDPPEDRVISIFAGCLANHDRAHSPSWYNRTFFGFFFKDQMCSVELLVPTYPGSEIDERVRCGEGEGGTYDCGEERPRGARRVCACSPQHDLSNEILLETF